MDEMRPTSRANSDANDPRNVVSRGERFLLRWEPVMGETYARRLRPALTTFRIGGVQGLVGLVLIIAWNAAFARIATPTQTVLSLGVLLVGMMSTLVVGAVMMIRLQLRIRNDLRRLGLAIRVTPPMRGVGEFEAWCEREHVTVDDLRQAGDSVRSPA